MNETRDYGKQLYRELEASRRRNLLPGIEVDELVELYDNPLFWLGVGVEYRMIGDTFEECKP